MDIALFQPDIPQNTGSILRMGACFGVAVHIIEPAGFPFSERALRRAGMDYLDHAEIRRHLDFAAFDRYRRDHGQRLVLLTTKATLSHHELTYRKDDILLCGQEGSGAPHWVHATVEEKVRIPLKPGMRSLNVAMAASIVLGEALRQTQGFPLGDGVGMDAGHGEELEHVRGGVRDNG